MWRSVVKAGRGERMAKVSYFLYCANIDRKTIPGGGEIVSLDNPLATITPEFVPGMFSFSIAFSVLGVNVSDTNNTLRLQIVDEAGVAVVDTGDFPMAPLPPDETEVPDEHKGYNFSMDFRNVVFTHNGLYSTKIFFNKSEISEHPIYVCGKKTVK